MHSLSVLAQVLIHNKAKAFENIEQLKYQERKKERPNKDGEKQQQNKWQWRSKATGGCVRAEETELTFDLPLHPVLPLLEVDGSVVVDGHTHTHTNLGVHPPPNFE